MIPEAQVKVIVKETVRETFLNLGLNVSDSDDIINYQQDMHWVRAARIRGQALGLGSLQHVISMTLSALGAALVLTLFNSVSRN